MSRNTTTIAALLVTLAGQAASAQVDATYVGPNGGSYADSGNWDIGAVPINGGSTYNVILPFSSSVTFDLLGLNEISSLDSASGSSLVVDGADLTVLNTSVVNGASVLAQNGSMFTMQSGADNLDNSSFIADGSGVGLGATIYRTIAEGGIEMFKATNGGTFVAPNMTMLIADPDTNSFATEWASVVSQNNSVMDLSSVTTVGGPVTDIDSDRIRFYAHGNSSIDLGGVTSFSGPSRWELHFNSNITLGPTAISPEHVVINDSVLTMPGLTDLEDSYVELHGSYTLNSPPISSIDHSQFRLLSAAFFSAPVTSYQHVGRGGVEAIRSEFGSTMHLPGIVNMTIEPNTNNFASEWITFTANGGGTINFSGLTTVNGPTQNTLRDRLHFQSVGVGSIISLPVATTITGATQFTANDGGTIDVGPADPIGLREIHVDGGTLNMPGLSTMAGRKLTLGGAYTLNTPPITLIDGAELKVITGGSYASPAVSYATSGQGAQDGFRAEHAGSVLSAPLMTMVSAEPNTNVFQTEHFGIRAFNGGTVDLSNVQTFAGPVVNTQRDAMTFEAAGIGSHVDLTGATSITGATQWYAGNGGHIEVGTADPTDARAFYIDGGTLTMPNLSGIANTTFDLGGSFTLNTPPLTDIDGATMVVRNGGNYVSPATEYAATGTGYHEPFTAIGTGSVLDMSAMTTLLLDPDTSVASEISRIQALAGGVVDLGNVTTLDGATSDPSVDRVQLLANGIGSRIDLGAVQQVLGHMSLDVSNGAEVDFSGDIISPVGGVTFVRSGGTLKVGGNFLFAGEGGDEVDFQDGTLHFNGAKLQTFECAAEDVGLPGGPLTGNMIVGQIIVGEPGKPATLRLCDGVDNGNRGAGNAEALYIAGVNGGDGLVLNPGSRLVLEDLETYVYQGGAWVHLNALLGGATCMPFAGGEVCISGCRADFNQDGFLNTSDFIAFLNAYNAGDFSTDFNCDQILNTSDFIAYLNAYNAGC